MFGSELKKAKVGPKQEVSRTHGFRKWFITQCDRSGMSFSTREYISGHRLSNQDPSYIRYAEEDRLAEYVKAIPLLTIDRSQRLRQENQELKKNQNDYLAELGDLRHDFKEMKQLLVLLNKESQKELVDELFQKVGDKADIEWSCDS
jgi:hypothetical protein